VTEYVLVVTAAAIICNHVTVTYRSQNTTFTSLQQRL